jgi:predicted NBD/HSP70 family sugar kinase
VPPRAGATQEEVRRHNLATLLAHLHVEGATSRADLTTRMGLNRSTIGDLTADLVAAALVRELPGDPRREPGTAGRALTGRPSHLVLPESERVFVLAVDIRVGQLIVARIGLGGVVLARRDLVHEAGSHALGDVVRALAFACRELLAGTPPGSVCIGVGVSVPGVVRREDGLVHFAPNLGWVDEPVGRALATRLGLPVRVGNDADLGVLAEHTRGAAVGCDHVVYLAGEVGIGGGIMAGGRRLEGFGGYAGEVGHLLVNRTGRRCRCGARGCWETEIGERALLVASKRPAGGGVPAVREVLAAARAGEHAAGAAVRQVCGWLGAGVGAIVNLFNPEIVIFGGILGEIYLAGAEQVHAAISASALAAPRNQVQLKVAGLDPDSTLFGAAELAFEPLLLDPLDTLASRTA